MMEDIPSALLVESVYGAGKGSCSNSSLAVLDSNKYVRYTSEQVEVLERLYNDCPKPSSLRRQHLIRDNPILQNIEPKQIKVWFQNRRCREKQRKETSRLQNLNGKLTAMNKLLMEENDRLQKQVAQLLYDNACLRQQMHAGGITTDTSCDSVVTSNLQQLQQTPPPAPQQSQNNAAHSAILSLAQETLTEFLSKATGTTVDWIPMPGMKPGPDTTAMVNVSYGCSRVCGLVSLDPAKVAEIIKDRQMWQNDCRQLQRLNIYSTSNGGVLEVLYWQMYAPTTLAPARDFCTLRYTSLLEDGSYVICERSLNGNYGVPTAPVQQSFVRAEMLSSGCLIRPCEGTGSIVILIDHMDLEPWSVPEVLRPIYDLSSVLACKQTIAAMSHLRHEAQEAVCETPGSSRQLATLSSIKRRLARGFNDAVNSFEDDGWSTMPSDGIDDDVTVTIKTGSISTKDIGVQLVMCVKASMLLQNVPPSLLVSFLRENRSEWVDLNIELNSPIPFKSNDFLFNSHTLHQNGEKDELLELIRVDGSSSLSRDIQLIQLCTGLDKSASAVYAQMLFALIDESISDEAPLLPSGFSIIPLENIISPAGNSPKRTLDLASSLEDHGPAEVTSCRDANEICNLRSVLTLAFQFRFENHNQDNMAMVARRYIRNIVCMVQRVALALSPSTSIVGSPPMHAWISETGLEASIIRSYKLNLGADLLAGLVDASASFEDEQKYLANALWHHSNAVVCCSCKSVPVFTYANEAALEMLETSAVMLPGLPWEATLDEDATKNMYAVFSQVILEQGYAYLPGGVRVSSKGRAACFERAVAWRVLDEATNSIRGVAFAYFNWAFTF